MTTRSRHRGYLEAWSMVICGQILPRREIYRLLTTRWFYISIIYVACSPPEQQPPPRACLVSSRLCACMRAPMRSELVPRFPSAPRAINLTRPRPLVSHLAAAPAHIAEVPALHRASPPHQLAPTTCLLALRPPELEMQLTQDSSDLELAQDSSEMELAPVSQMEVAPVSDLELAQDSSEMDLALVSQMEVAPVSDLELAQDSSEMELAPVSEMELAPALQMEMASDSITPELQELAPDSEMVPDSLPPGAFLCPRCQLVGLLQLLHLV
ncbi:unnamed protein product [Urochloa humidicola]